MLVKVHGVRKLDFKTDDGKEIKGTNIFVTYPVEHVEGETVDKVFILADKTDILPVFKFGEEYDFVQETVGFGKNAKTSIIEVRKNGKIVNSKMPF